MVFKRIVAASLASLAVLAGTATTSYAAYEDGSCQASEFCLYKNTNYSGGVHDFGPDDGAYIAEWFSGTATLVNNNASSSHNRFNYGIYTYEYSGYSGPAQYHRATGTGCASTECPAYSNLGSHNDKLSSHSGWW
ncbi:peptidase inhibitor family I36 protein [Streptomyces sp. NPDC056480]|uniref:peptidase inhibitor family I36 protein n=1 Tax=Streptomyces sp. NPDC056480 TaxID=3345833 RepID=UPI00367F3C1E